MFSHIKSLYSCNCQIKSLWSIEKHSVFFFFSIDIVSIHVLFYNIFITPLKIIQKSVQNSFWMFLSIWIILLTTLLLNNYSIVQLEQQSVLKMKLSFLPNSFSFLWTIANVWLKMRHNAKYKILEHKLLLRFLPFHEYLIQKNSYPLKEWFSKVQSVLDFSC